MKIGIKRQDRHINGKIVVDLFQPKDKETQIGQL